MKMTNQPRRAFYALAVLTVFFTSCQKENQSTELEAESATIAVAASEAATGSTSGTDSVYLLQPCKRDEKRERITEAQLQASIKTYIADNYAGASFHKAFAVKNRTGNASGYVVVIYFDDKPVGLLFSTDGNFVRVLEQRERGDLNGPGHRRGGRFEHRDGQQRDTIAISALPAAITAYFAGNFTIDVVVKAYRGKDNSIIIVSKNNSGVFATVFSAINGFIRRVQFPSRPGQHISIELRQLPSVVVNYLAQTFPNYVFNKAFEVSLNGTVQGYIILLDANNTRYAIAFDATGNFLKLKVIR